MAMIKSMCILLNAAVVFMAVAPIGEAISCTVVLSYLDPCIPYVTNKGPLGSCCGGVKGLYGAAKTTSDRQSVCTCLKSAAHSGTGVSMDKAAGLPGKCGIRIPYKIRRSIDCSKVT